MSMLDEQIKELREAARNIQGNLGRCLYRRKDVDEMQQVSGMLFEAADTIEGLRDRLQPVPAELDYIEDRSRWFQLFGTPERVVQTMITVRNECEEVGACYPNCPFRDAPACPSSVEPRDNDALLDWLEGDSDGE